jgi:hypothetical protein
VSIGIPFVGNTTFRRYICLKKNIANGFIDEKCAPKKILAGNIPTDLFHQ